MNSEDNIDAESDESEDLEERRSKQPISENCIEPDDESDMDVGEIKPVSFFKKAKQLDSSDSDASSDSSSKRRSCSSDDKSKFGVDDPDVDDPDVDASDDEDEIKKSVSPKMKFKRSKSTTVNYYKPSDQEATCKVPKEVLGIAEDLYPRAGKSNKMNSKDIVSRSDESEYLAKVRKDLPARHRKSTFSSDDYNDDENDENKDEDNNNSNENNVKKNAERDSPPKRHALREISCNDDNNKSSGRDIRLWKKSSTVSAKKKSQNHHDSASRSKQPITDDYREPNDDSDINGGENVKPMSSAKRAKQLASSDSDTDASATKSPQNTPDSSGKRKICASHVDTSTDDDEDDDKEGIYLSTSAKKKVKRTKTGCSSSQETMRSGYTVGERAVNIEDDDGESESSSERNSESNNSSGTSSDSSNSVETEEGDIENDSSSDSTSWSDIYDDGENDSSTESNSDSSSSSDTRSNRPNKEELGNYILWLAMKAGGKSCTKKQDQEIEDSKNKLKKKLDYWMNICQSQAWIKKIRVDINKYPQFVDTESQSELQGGDMQHLEICQVCKRENHPWSKKVMLKGMPYKRDTYEKLDDDDDDDDDVEEEEPVQYYMGRFCHLRTKVYHNLYHFGYDVYHQCKEKLKYIEEVDDRYESVAKSLKDEMYQKLQAYMQEADNYLTKDGNRTNKRWKDEYVP